MQQMLLERAVLDGGVGVGEEVLVIVAVEQRDARQARQRHERCRRVALAPHDDGALEHDLRIVAFEPTRVRAHLGAGDLSWCRSLGHEDKALGREAQLVQRSDVGVRQHEDLGGDAVWHVGPFVVTTEQPQRAHHDSCRRLVGHVVLVVVIA
jgi:hypothetical protein